MLVALSFIFVAYQMVVRIFFGVMLADIIDIFDISMSSVGIAAGGYYFSFALSSIVTSLLFMRCNFLLIMSWGMLMMTIGLICFLMPGLGVFGVVLGRVLLGLGSGMSLPLYLKVFNIFYDADYIKMMVNFMFFNCMTVLSMTLYFVKPQYTVIYDYYDIMYVFLIIGVVLGILFFRLYFTFKFDEKGVSFTMGDIKAFICDKRVIFLSLIGGLLAGTPDAFADLWALLFLEKCCHIQYIEYIMIFFWMTYACAGFVLRYIFSCLRVTVVRFMIYIALVLLSVYLSFFVFAYYGVNICCKNTQYYLITFLMIVLAMCCGYKPFLFGAATRFMNNNFSILGVVIINSCCMFFGQVFHLIIGVVLDFTSLFSSLSVRYICALAIIPICILLSIVICLCCGSVLTKDLSKR